MTHLTLFFNHMIKIVFLYFQCDVMTYVISLNLIMKYATQTDNSDLLQKVKVDERNAKGETARALAMMYGYTKIVSLIDSRTPRAKPGGR